MDEGVQRPRPAVLLILDGFGVAPDGDGNAVTRANMPVFRDLVRRYPAMTLRASGQEVGLSWGEMGNSEVGHLAIGAGRVYYQTLPRIDRDIEAGSFFENAELAALMDDAKARGVALHLIGLVSAGKVHSSDVHLHALIEMAVRRGLSSVFVHAITDGRDTLYNAAGDFFKTLQEKMDAAKVGKIASISGRYYAMDRDNRWDRTKLAYEAMVLGQGPTNPDAMSVLMSSYVKEIYDEQIVPTVITEHGAPVGPIKNGDVIVFFNFRPDRMRQLVKAFCLSQFDGFARNYLGQSPIVTMTEVEAGLPVEVAFPPEVVSNSLAEVLSNAGLSQFHIAETEKYAHVTFFLNGTKEEPFPGETRAIIPSPKVASYDQTPQMSAGALTDRLLKEIKADAADFYAVNFANPDMVAHTGDFPATVKANETVDACLGRIVEAVEGKGGVVFLTADHGNAEEVKNLRTGEMDKEHSTNPVPFLVIGKSFEGMEGPSGQIPEGDLSLVAPIGMLADVAPTILNVLQVSQPPEMTGTPLL